ncbi:MAG: hypothetical protein ACI4O4_07990, partial [Candidatus Ventricola sp.]
MPCALWQGTLRNKETCIGHRAAHFDGQVGSGSAHGALGKESREKMRIVQYDGEESEAIDMNREEHIVIRGLRQNNLKNVSLDIPKGKIVVFTGVSGSG